ncbi:seryl-tRNA synthetase [Streptomyces sp. LBL]|uniref:serine--tRNA ligase n=1 Tax=Streptomyces sp. LBL TaxID=2940562 RepID=UPI002474C8FB|nr:serine--tRNA ligase [Streptomyces sp. LBL]MDH6624414.1 seryl-tRNA synthetase [Streptomyces sp. LBL]
MIDPNLLLHDVEAVAAALEKKGTSPEAVHQAHAALLDRRSALSELETLRAEMNRRSKEVGKLLAQRDPAAMEERKRLGELKAQISKQEAEYREAEEQFRHHMLRLPNLPSPDAPVGSTEDSNVVLRREGPSVEMFQGKEYRPHWDIAADLKVFDPERAAKLSGSGFALLYGDGARLLRALVQFGLDIHRDTYLETVVPHLVRGPIMEGTGHLPKFADDAYNTTLDDLWLVPTGEVPLTGLHQNEILEPGDLPKRYMTHTASFRREAGSAGKDTRGFQRVHEFHKVELVRICTPETFQEEFDALLADAEKPLRMLGLPYRVVDLCTGDLTFSSTRIFDLEVYAPGVGKWLECASVGHFSDFQARRGNIRYRTAEGKTAPVHTLNGTGIVTPRVWAALLEHGQRPDGTVELPEVLVPYMGKKILEPLG